MSSSAEKTKLEGYDLESCDWIYFYSSRLQTALYLAKVKQRQYVITMMIVLFGVVAVVLLALLPHNSNYIKQSDNQKSLAIIVSGGYDTAYNAKTSVELLHGDGRPWCSLPDLPVISFGHSQTGLEACGGGGPLDYKCARLSNGSWELSHMLAEEPAGRIGHSSWASPLGTVLIGGTYKENSTTELLDDTTDSSTFHFPLKYSKRSVASCLYIIYVSTYIPTTTRIDFCGIELEEEVILTGGLWLVGFHNTTHTTTKVTVYNSDGFLTDLPDFNIGRYGHTCGHFVNSDKLVLFVCEADL